MSIEAVEAVIDLIELGAVATNEDIVKCLRSAIAMKSEPAAIATGTYGGRFTYVSNTPHVVFPDGTAFYTRPQPNREWVGLTELEETGILLSSNTVYSAMKFTETKLREKNA
jgi:hypothetical protein